MSNVQRVGDSNTRGGRILSGESSVRVNGRPIAVPGKPVSWHGKRKHARAKTAGGVGSVKAGGKPVIVRGNTDDCGDKRQGGSGNVRAG
jgi:uncharacterized Zn-binding protein involved in type VI secretion